MRLIAILGFAIVLGSASSSIAGDSALRQSSPAIELSALHSPILTHRRIPRPRCRLGEVLATECFKWAPPLPGKLVGGCIESELECVTPMKIN